MESGNSARSTTSEAPELLPLGGNQRVASMRRHGTNEWLRHELRQPTTEDVLEYWRARVREKKTEGAAMLELYRRLAKRVAGYGADDPQRAPRLHRVGAVMLVARVEEDALSAPPEVDPAYDWVMLRALWSPAEGQHDMRWFTRLVHCLDPMTADEDTEFDRELNKAIVVGGSRTGETILPLRQAVLLKWYDRKIRKVEGYAVPFDDDQGTAAAITKHMDPFHKLVAFELFLSGMGAAELRTPPAPGTGEEELEAAIE